MANLSRMSCQGCGSNIEYYKGQGLFKCGNCGSIYESLGGPEGVSVIQISVEHAGTAEQSAIGQPSYQSYQQAPAASLESHPFPQQPQPSMGQPQAGYQQQGYAEQAQAGYQQPLSYQEPQPGYQQPWAGQQPVPAITVPKPNLGKFAEFFRFRTFITPLIIQIAFWLGFLGCVIGGIVLLAKSEAPWLGIIILFVGPLWVRIWCELLILAFRIYDTLKRISEYAWYASFNIYKLVEAEGKVEEAE